MNPKHFDLIQRLNKCRLLPASWEKRFIRTLASASLEGPDLSEEQAKQLERLHYKYRAQLGETMRYQPSDRKRQDWENKLDRWQAGKPQ